MTDTPERAIREAEEWLTSVKDKLALAQDDESAATVCCALAIHAIIRANDALTLKFLNIKSTRHDDAPELYAKLVKQNKIGPEHQHFQRIIKNAMLDKSGADYGKKTFTYEQAQHYADDAEEFVEFAKRQVE